MEENKIPETAEQENTEAQVEEAAAEAVEEAAVDTGAQTAEVQINEIASETAEEEIVSDDAQESAEAQAEATDDTNEDTEVKAEDAAETVVESETIEAFDESEETLPENLEYGIEEQEEQKKRFPLQIPVIVAACILVVALLGYFLFTGFILKEPEGVTWSTEVDGATYYFEFKNNNVFKAYVGSVEIDSTYQKTKSDSGNTLTVGTNVGNFYSGSPATYKITGSRILGNQVMEYSYGEGYDFSVKQASRKEVNLDLPKDFVPDNDIIGTWVFRYYGYDIYKVTFNDNGSMKLQMIQDGITYNGTYTIDGDNINFTYYVSDSVAAPLQYSVNGDTLTFLGATFVREGSEATVDQQLQVPTN